MTDNISRPTGRINYIDALRGLSMVLVVLAHVYLFMSPRHWDGSPVAAVLMSFRMPLFFFVSGFFAFRAVERWSASLAADVVVRKIRAQIICAVVFFMLFQYVNGDPIFEFLRTGFGYFWFTIALFQMFIIYLASALLSRLSKRNLVDPVMIIGAVASALMGLTIFKSGIGVVLSWHQVLVYFQFFAVGVLVRKHREGFIKLIASNWFRTIAVVLFVAGCFVFYCNWYSRPTTLSGYLTQEVIHRYAGLFTVLIFFHDREAYFDGSADVARFLRFTGKRTLDVYMMHIFFVPHLAGAAWVAQLMRPDMVVLKLAVGLAIALAIVGLCLLCSNILRSSKTLAVWLFGVRA